MIQILNLGGLTKVYLPDSRYPTLGNEGNEFEFDTKQIHNLYKALGEKIAEMDYYDGSSRIDLINSDETFN